MKFDINIYGTSCFIRPHVLKACLSFFPLLLFLVNTETVWEAEELKGWKAISSAGGGGGGGRRYKVITPPPHPLTHAGAVPQSHPQREYKTRRPPIPSARQRAPSHAFDLGGI